LEDLGSANRAWVQVYVGPWVGCFLGGRNETFLMISAAVVALSANGALADAHMPFAQGEGAFNWDS